MPSTPTPGSATAPATELPEPVRSALDEIETALPTGTPPEDAARRRLADDVINDLERRLRDPIPRALLSRPKIFAWCVERALADAGPEPVPGGTSSFRPAEPLTEEPAKAARSRKGGKS